MTPLDSMTIVPVVSLTVAWASKNCPEPPI